jgi:spore maturation protein CgeB
MKILYIDPAVRSATSAKYRYYDGVFGQLVKMHDVRLFQGVATDINQILDRTDFNPDAIIFGIGWFGKAKYFGKIENLNVPTICFLYKPQNDLEQKLNFCRINDIDLIVTPIPTYYEFEKATGVKTALFPFGFDPEFFHPRAEISKEYGIGFSGALHQSILYPNDSFQVQNLRPQMGKILQDIKDVNVFWKSSDDASKAFINSYEEYAQTINKSQMWLATLAAFGDVTPRYYEVLGSGTLLFCQKIPDTYKFLLKGGENCIEFNDDLSDFEEKIISYLQHPEEIKRITSNAINFFHNNWTWNHRAQKMVELIEDIMK